MKRPRLITRPLALALCLAWPAHSSPPAPLSVEPLPADRYIAKVAAAHPGHILLVNFWATWCDPCREELPGLLAAMRSTSATAKPTIDLVLVSLDSSKTDLPKARDFLKSVHAEGPHFIAAPGDPELFINAVDPTWDGTVPYTLGYGSDGKLVWRLRGPQSEDAFKRAIAALGKSK